MLHSKPLGVTLPRTKPLGVTPVSQSSVCGGVIIRRMVPYKVDDEWYTPDDAWGSISHLVLPGTKIWEPFYGDGRSTLALKRMGYDVVDASPDFFTSKKLADIVVTNPPFSKLAQVVDRLMELGVTFILLIPLHRMGSSELRDRLNKDSTRCVSLVFPRQRIDYIKPGRDRSRSPFYSVFLVVGIDSSLTIL